MAVAGEPEVVSDHPAALVWDGKRLPGLWLTHDAVTVAAQRARTFGLGAVAIRNSHHIGCLAVFLERPAREGLMAIVASSDPSLQAVAPFGGTAPLMTRTRSRSASRRMRTPSSSTSALRSRRWASPIASVAAAGGSRPHGRLTPQAPQRTILPCSRRTHPARFCP
jgi:hypothetical protein